MSTVLQVIGGVVVIGLTGAVANYVFAWVLGNVRAFRANLRGERYLG